MDPWLGHMRAAGQRPLLELGCDVGGDTAWLCEQGFDVVAGDIEMPALRYCAGGAPRARLLQFDLRRPLPFADAAFSVIVASLCLHYFDWSTTERAVAEVRRCLAPGGLLLFRANSVRDVNHGADEGVEIEPGLRRTHGTYSEEKRFFATSPTWSGCSRAELGPGCPAANPRSRATRRPRSPGNWRCCAARPPRRPRPDR